MCGVPISTSTLAPPLSSSSSSSPSTCPASPVLPVSSVFSACSTRITPLWSCLVDSVDDRYRQAGLDAPCVTFGAKLGIHHRTGHTWRVRFSVLGPLVVRSGGVQLEIKARQQRAVLSRLIVADGTVVSIDALIDAVWGPSPTREVVGGLHTLLARIRRVIEPDRPAHTRTTVLVREPSGYALRVERDSVDARRFTAALVGGREHLTANRPAQALTLLDAGLAEWRGAPYAEFAAEDWAVPEVIRLEE